MDELANIDATRYLADNASLREALSIDDGATLVAHPLGEGEHNLNYWFEGPTTTTRYVLRINVTPQPFHVDQVRYEHDALRAIEPSGCTPMAHYIDDSPDAPAHGVLVESFCPGSQLDFDHLQPGDLDHAAQMMADVHAVSLADGCPIFKPADPAQTLFDECLDRFDAYYASGYEEPRITHWVELFVDATRHALEDTPAAEDATHCINTETLPSHFLLPGKDAADAAISGSRQPGYFIDWERPIVGEVAQDLAFFTSLVSTYWDSDYLFPASDIEGFLAMYWKAVDGRFAPHDFERRFRLWQMLTALRSTGWICKALKRYNEGDAHMTAKARRKMPVYLSDEFMELIAAECFHL